MQADVGQTGGVREKKQSHRVVTDMFCHTHRTEKGVTTDISFTSCKLAHLLLTKIMTMVAMSRRNTPEILELFLSVKCRKVCSSMFGFTCHQYYMYQ